MNFIQRGLRKFIKDALAEEVVLANGTIDKRDVEDPTAKFHGTRYVPQVQNITRVRKNVEFIRPEYDLPTIANAVQMDGILQRATNIFTEQVLKNGYEIVSKNERAQRHVHRRIKEIENLTGCPFYELMNSITRQLVTYGNAFIIKVRSGTKSRFGKPYMLYNREYDPIVGLFVADATTIQVGINDSGQIVNFKQSVHGQETYWDEREVIHIAYNRIPGTLMGMSSIIPVLDDIRALRKLEEEIEILGFQYSIPLYLYKVGTKEIPPAPGELDQATAQINNMPAYGMLVVPGHHTIEVPTNNNTPVDLLSFINHFKTRIYAGLGVSPVAMGEVSTSNRNTSEVMDTSMQTITKRYQQLIKCRLEMDLFRELLLDGKFDIFTDVVEFSFPEIDLESQIKKETNIIAKWQNNMITRKEARLELDYEATIDEDDTFLYQIDIPKIEAQKSIQVELANMKAKSIAGKSGSASGPNNTRLLTGPASSGSAVTRSTHKAIGASKAVREINIKVAPENQYGKSTGRPKFVKDTFKILANDSVNKINLLLYNGAKDRPLNVNKLNERVSHNLKEAIIDYLNSNLKDISEYYHLKVQKEPIDNYLNEVELILRDKIIRAAKRSSDDSKIGIFSDELRDFLELQKQKTENLAKLLVYKSLGYTTILVSTEDCQLHTATMLNLKDLEYNNIPPFKYGCKCYISEKVLNEFNEISTEEYIG